jgi:hypothetical protein
LSESGCPGFEDFQDFSLKFDILDVDLMINSTAVRVNIELVENQKSLHHTNF